MKVNVLKENLAKSLNTVGRIVSTKNSLPVLSHVLIKTEDGRLKLASTNLEIGITYKIGGKVEENGSITVPARLFTELVNSLPGDKVEMSLNDLTLKIMSGNFKAEIKGITAEDFPLIPDIKESKVLAMDNKIFRDALKLVSFAAAVDDSRPVLSGVFIVKEGKNLTFAATDSYRLAEKNITLSKDLGTDFSVIVPIRTINEILKIVSDIDGEINVYLSDNQISFEVDGVELISRLIEGQYPNYRQIIPEGSETKANIKSADFLNILKVAVLFARENGNTLSIKINPKGKIEVNVIASQVGSNESFLDADVTGKGGEISFNGRFIMDYIQNVNSKEISLEITGELTPGIMRTAEIKDYVYIIMPLRS